MELTKGQKILQAIFQESWESESFKKRLIENPLDMIEELTGVRLNVPEGKEIVIVDQSDNNKTYINIPAEPNAENMALTQEQLEIIAGGGTPTPPKIDDTVSSMAD